MSDQHLIRVIFLVCCVAVGLIGLRAHNLIAWPWAIVLAPLGLLFLSGVTAVVLIGLLERKRSQ